jgi:hypothetical protein
MVSYFLTEIMCGHNKKVVATLICFNQLPLTSLIKVSSLVFCVERREVFMLLLPTARDLVWSLKPKAVSERLYRTASLTLDRSRVFIIATRCRNFAVVD